MTTRTLWLHVGIPKTSTTSYQSWMRAQAGALEHAGLLYPDHFGAGNDKHNFLVGNLRHKPDLPILERVLSDCHTPQMLLSDEGLTNHLDDFNPDALGRFRELTQGWTVKIILVTRDAESWTHSYHKQCVLNPNNGASPLWGTQMTSDQIKDHPRIKRLVDHDSLSIDLQTAFGAARVHQFKFEDPDWFRASLDLIGVKFEKAASLPRSNQSLPDWSIELLRRVNSATDDTDIRNQWKMALQSYLGTNHTILTNLSGAKAELDMNVYKNLTSNQDSFPSSEKSNADQFLDFINQKNPKL